MKKTTKRILSLLLMSILVFASVLTLSSCDLSALPIQLPEAVSITKTEINEEGELIVHYSDGRKENLGIVVGADGKDGEDGIDTSVLVTSAAINASGELVLTYSDGTEQNLGVVVGKDGVDTSVRVSAAQINASGELILYYSDGTEENLGVVVGKDGEDADAPPTNVEINVSGNAESATAAVAYAAPSVVSVYCKFTNVYPAAQSAGSGVIYSLDKTTGDALIITNYHVVYDDSGAIANEIGVYVYGSRLEKYTIPAEFIGGSMREDIAVLRVTGSELLKSSIAKAATLADSDAIYPGDTAIAIGNPLGYGISATYGKVNVPTESLDTVACDNRTEVTLRVIRIDTAVNGGNSGGGLFDGEGRLIGIVNAKSIETNVENVGYALPANKVRALVDNIVYHCLDGDYITPLRPTLGITVQIAESLASVNGEGLIDITETVAVIGVDEGTAAYGVFLEGDILVSVTVAERTVQITRMHHLLDAILDLRPGESIAFKVLREGVETALSITPAKSLYNPC